MNSTHDSLITLLMLRLSLVCRIKLAKHAKLVNRCYKDLDGTLTGS